MKQKISYFVILTALFAACSHKPKDVSNESRGEPAPKTQASMEAKQVASEQQAQYVTEIRFPKGSTQLTAESRKKIERLLSSVQDHRSIDEVKVISWADEAYPSQQQKSLSKEQKKLAEERNEEIKGFLKTQDKKVPIEVHSMAVRPGAFGNLWGSSDARIKKSLETSGLTKEGLKAKTSHAIVMIVVK